MPAHRLLGGFGARGALDLGRLDPGRFCAVGGHSPAVLTSAAEAGGAGFGSAAEFAKHDLLASAGGTRPIHAGVNRLGDHDFLRPAATQYAHELQRDGAKLSFHVSPGVHHGRYWDAHFAQYLRFYAEACG